VAVSVARGLEVDVDATSISGRLSSTMPLDGTTGARPRRRLDQRQDSLGDVKVSSRRSVMLIRILSLRMASRALADVLPRDCSSLNV